jgi:hypothetical protein
LNILAVVALEPGFNVVPAGYLQAMKLLCWVRFFNEATMKTLFMCAAVCLIQMNTLQERPVVHLQPHSHLIQSGFGGKLLELVNSPPEVDLPAAPPKLDSQGEPWLVDVKNLGPGAVVVTGEKLFRVEIGVGRTVRISSNGRAYSVKK